MRSGVVGRPPLARHGCPRLLSSLMRTCLEIMFSLYHALYECARALQALAIHAMIDQTFYAEG